MSTTHNDDAIRLMYKQISKNYKNSRVNNLIILGDWK